MSELTKLNNLLSLDRNRPKEMTEAEFNEFKLRRNAAIDEVAKSTNPSVAAIGSDYLMGRDFGHHETRQKIRKLIGVI